MLRIITELLNPSQPQTRPAQHSYRVYQPEKPLNFVPRSDPSWSMLSRR